MKEAVYQSESIHCSCGVSFPVDLEDELASDLNTSFQDETEGERQFECPSCKMRYNLKLQLEKVIQLNWSDLEVLGQFVEGGAGKVVNVEALIGRHIGDTVSFYNEDEDEVSFFPDGTFITAEKEYKVENGVIVSIWSVSDDNQLSLFEELQIA